MNSTFSTHKFLFLLAGFILSVPLLALAAQGMGNQQVNTAAQHAGFASKAMKVDGVHLHLHHVINCLVGPGGDGFDAKAGNPCKDQGNGALHAKNLSMEDETSLQQALALARIGVKIRNEKAARNTAMAVRELLLASHSGM